MKHLLKSAIYFLSFAMFAQVGIGQSSIEGFTAATVISESDLVWAVDVSEAYPNDRKTTFEQIAAPFAADPSTNSAFDATEWAADLNITSAFADITGKPTTLSGYGITDAASAAQGALADSATQATDWDTLVKINAVSTDTDAVLDTDIGATVQAYDADLDDLADGSLTGSKIGTGISGTNVSSGTVADARIASTITRDSELAAAVRTRAFEGGVRLSGGSTNSAVYADFLPFDTGALQGDFAIVCPSLDIKASDIPTNSTGNYTLISYGAVVLSSSSYGGLSLVIRPVGDANEFYFRWQGNGSSAYEQINFFDSDAYLGHHQFTIVFDVSSDVYLYDKGVLIGTLGSAPTVYPKRSGGQGKLRIGLNYTFASGDPFIGPMYGGFAHLNTTLTATQAAEIYAQGFSGWLAANPGYMWADQSFRDPATTWSNGSGGGSSSFGSFTSDTEGFVGSGNKGGAYLSCDIKKDGVYNIEFNASVQSGTGSFALGTATSSVAISSNIIQNINNYSSASLEAGEGLKTHQFIATVDASLVGFYYGSGSVSLTIENFVITKVGTLIHLPMDEGIGLQLRDRSTNHYDALLTATGTQHLQPRDSGYVRGFGLDASSNDYVTSATVDVIPADCVIESVQIIDQEGETSGGTIIQRSDGTNHNGLHSGVALVSKGSVSVAASAAQITNDQRIRTATASGASNIDVRVNYIKLNQ